MAHEELPDDDTPSRGRARGWDWVVHGDGRETGHAR